MKSTTNNIANMERKPTQRRTRRCIPPSSLMWLTLILPSCVYGYNIDLPSYTIHRRENNTMFGFSIAFHRLAGQNGFTQSNSLVVGAPKFDTSSYQQGVKEAGAVFKCGMNDGDCSLVKFDSSGNHRNTYGDVIERKSYQWLGATVSTSRNSDLIVACAPRYVFHTMTPAKALRNDPVGTCFTSRNFADFNEVSPCRTNNWGYHRQGSCQAGFSAATSSNGDRLYIGAPGSWYWQGQAYSISPDASFPYKPPFYQPFGTGGQTYSYDVTRPENQVFSTSESSSQDDDSYLGYSMTTGDFNGDRIDDVAIGMPRGAGLLGKIVVNGWNMNNIFNITGRQIGEYFGYALATSDVNGDGLDDLIIGAPMFSEPGNVEGKYDVGRVYILQQTNTRDADRWLTEHIRDGYNTKGRFGLSLASLGDINRDGYGDFAVGAPYDGPEGRGVVYIFHGSATGPLPKPSQIIKSEDIVDGAPFPRTFGFALSGGVDMDGNSYPDLAVGAYASAQVFIFKSRPVAGVNAKTSFISPSKLISLDENNCRVGGRDAVCVNITTCLNYTGEYLPSRLEFELSWVLDSKKTKNPRMFFVRDQGKNVRNMPVNLSYGRTMCYEEAVYLADSIQDKLTPLEVEMRYNLRNSQSFSPVVRRKREALFPVIDQNREIVLRDAINIRKNCGPDNICEPDLRLDVKTVDKYLLGSDKPLVIEVLISNTNEDAFEANFYMILPKNIEYKKIHPPLDKMDSPVTCTAPTNLNNYTLKCNIGNPLQRNRVVKFEVELRPTQKSGMAPSYDFYMEANSTNTEKPGSEFDNVIRKSIGIWVETDLAVEGTSLPDFQLYKASDYKSVENATMETDLGPQVVHFYNIRNNGPSTVEEAVVLIHYPYQTVGGDLLMYVTNQPETDGNIVCDPHINVNSRNLQLDQNLVRKSYLEQIGAVVRTSASASGYQLHFEKSQGGVSGGSTAVSIGRGTKVISAEEKKRLEKEDEQDVSGDASFVHTQRANAAAEANTHSGNTGSGANWSHFSSWNSSSDERGPPSIVVSTRNRTIHYNQDGEPYVVESSTEYVRNFEQSPNYNSQQFSANYQQAGGTSGHAGGGGQNAHAETLPQSGGHSVRGHIQIASPSSSSGYQQSYANYGNQAESARGGNRPSQGHNTQRLGGGAAYNDFSQTGDSSSMGKVAQGGHGFQAGTLDLGTLNRGNVDNELRHQGAPTDSSGNYGYQYSSSSGSPHGGVVYQQSSSFSDGKPKYFGREDEDQQGGQQQWSHSSTSHRRFRRDNEEPAQIDLNSPCKAAKCETIRCVAKNLGKDDGVWVALRTRMVAATMEKLAPNVPLNVSTMAVSYVTQLPFIGEPKDEIKKSHEIFYKAVPEPIPVPDVVPLWVVVLAACAGALILLLLIFLLYKCGFFNRNRPADHSMERQPLRNGYHGDEHL